MTWLDMNCLLKTKCQDGVLKETRDQKKAGAGQVTDRKRRE